MTPIIHTGDRALHQARTGEFRSQWLSLYDDCPWATACQHPDFVLPWYEFYQEQALPVLVCTQGEDGRLAGLLPLALMANGKQLVGAGERQAEYHAWLERRETGSAFVHAAIDALRKRFPRTDLKLKYLPPEVPLDWARRHREFSTHFDLRSHERPIIKVNPIAMDRQRRKKNNRQNFNRLARIGEVRFERVTGHDRFTGMFDAICNQYDFRQEALYHVMPFTSDPAKKPFFLELHRRGLLHVSVLMVGAGIAASHCGLLTASRAMHLGISTLSPQFASHSPGQLLIGMLGEQLVNEGIPLFDLTPGGDEYKGRYASDHDFVYELAIYGGAHTKLRGDASRGARRMLKNALHKAGLRTSDVRATLKKITRYRELGFPGLLESMRRAALTRPLLYRHSMRPLPSHGDIPAISIDAIADLFRFDPHGSHLTRWEFFKLAMQRMEASHHLYTCCDGNRLVLSCWVGPSTGQASPDGIVLYDLYVHRSLDDKNMLRQFVGRIVLDLRSRHPAEEIYFSGSLSNVMQAVIRQCGFSPESGNAPARYAATTQTTHADGTVISCYTNGMPPSIEAELVRLYDTLHSSMEFFRIFRSTAGLNAYVARRDDHAVAIFIFTCANGRIEVLNEMIDVDMEEVDRFVRHMLSIFPSVGSVGFKAIRTDTRGLAFPLQKHEAKETYVIDLPATPKEYTSALGKSTRTAVRYQLNKVARDNPSFESRFYEKEKVDPQHVRDILRLSEARISGKAYQFFHDEERILRLVRSCGFVNVLRIDGRLCAGSINYRIGTGVFGEAIGQCPEYERYGLGKLTVYLTVCESITRGAKKFYLGGGRFDFKNRMLGVRVAMERIDIYRSYGAVIRHLGTALQCAAEGCLRRLKKWLRDHDETPVSQFAVRFFHRWKNARSQS